jgi:resuscitation-promoting factor RpfB
MQASTKLSLAAVAAVAVTAPVGIALAADAHDTAQGRPAPLAAPLAGHRSVDGQMHNAAVAIHRRAHRRSAPVRIPPILRRIAECESHGNPRSIGGGGLYRGAYQFTVETYRSVGGRGDPARASMAEQTRRASILLARSGPSQWPVCSQ